MTKLKKILFYRYSAVSRKRRVKCPTATFQEKKKLYQIEYLKYPNINDDCKYPQLKLQGDEVLSNLI